MQEIWPHTRRGHGAASLQLHRTVKYKPSAITVEAERAAAEADASRRGAPAPRAAARSGAEQAHAWLQSPQTRWGQQPGCGLLFTILYGPGMSSGHGLAGTTSCGTS